MKKYLYHTRSISPNLAIFLLRTGAAGSMFIAHGMGKFNKAWGGNFEFADVFGMGETLSLILAVFAEAICSLLVAFGLFTRVALIPLIITMLVALFVIHADDPFAMQEKAYLYLLAFVTLFLTGPGTYSLDSRLKNSR